MPKLEVGIMGRINMQGLDTFGGRRMPMEKEEEMRAEEGKERGARSLSPGPRVV